MDLLSNPRILREMDGIRDRKELLAYLLEKEREESYEQ